MPHAFYLGGYDVDLYYYENAPAAHFCPQCDTLIAAYFPTSFKTPSKRGLFSTYDSQLVCSKRFKTYLEGLNLTGLNFVPLNDNASSFALPIESTVEFDSDRRGTRFLNPCPICKSFEEVIGATPVFLKNDQPLDEMGIFKTDLEFGTGRQKHPLVIIGQDLAAHLKREFRGLHIKPAFLKDEPCKLPNGRLI